MARIIKMFIQVVMNYPDEYDKYGNRIDGDRVQECNTIEELRDCIKKVVKEDVLNHIHLDFCERDNIVQSYGSVTVLLKETPGFHPVTCL